MKKSCGDLGQHVLEKFSSRSWIRGGEISCAPHTSFDEINDVVVRSERGELVPTLGVQCSHYRRRCVAGVDQVAAKNAFGGWCVENGKENSRSSPNGQKLEAFEYLTEDHRTTQATFRALEHGLT